MPFINVYTFFFTKEKSDLRNKTGMRRVSDPRQNHVQKTTGPTVYGGQHYGLKRPHPPPQSRVAGGRWSDWSQSTGRYLMGCNSERMSSSSDWHRISTSFSMSFNSSWSWVRSIRWFRLDLISRRRSQILMYWLTMDLIRFVSTLFIMSVLYYKLKECQVSHYETLDWVS